MDTVLVLMSTYNGDKYLEQQIKSIIEQEKVNTEILVRDDGSTDNTIKILDKYQKCGYLQYYKGDNIGPSKSFMDLISHIKNASYVAFSDQDDFWKKDKLIVAVEKLRNINVPAFYNSVVEVVDEQLVSKGKIYGSKKIYNFATQCSRNNVVGCSVVINRRLIELVTKYTPNHISMHDQWIAMVCKGHG